METNAQQADWWRRRLALLVDTAVRRLPRCAVTRSMNPLGPAKAAVRCLAPALLSIVTFDLVVIA